METFISETTELREAFLATEPMACSDAEWEKRRAAFAPPGQTSVTPVTVSARVPLQPYGEKLGFFRRLARRLVRRSVRWYSEELLCRQNQVNRALLERIETLEARVRELEEGRKP